MANEPIDPKTLDRPWRLWASLGIGTALVVGALLAFLVLPAFQRENAGLDLWTAFCRSLGITEGSPAYRQPVSTAKAAPVSQVAWGPEVLDILSNARPERGGRIAAAVCASCHGDEGVAATPELPSLAGQSAAAIYKQLHDYRSGARVHPLMTPVAQQLQLPDLANVAVFYGRNAETYAGLGRRGQAADRAIVRLATEGDAARRIPACNSCHVNGSGGPVETPIVSGQNHQYLANQLRAYKGGQRRNDVYQRMRNIAGALSDEEIEALANYYQGVL
ncbi:MAG TPA: c-type cytochrome [Allosphingosinicella sp.]